MNQRRIVQQIPLSLYQRWCLSVAALPGWCVWLYISVACIMVLGSIVLGLRGVYFSPPLVVGLLVNLCLLLLMLTVDLSRTMQVSALAAMRDLAHGFAFSTADRVVCVSEAGIEFAVAGLLHPQPDADLPYHGHTYTLWYSPHSRVLWSITPT